MSGFRCWIFMHLAKKRQVLLHTLIALLPWSHAGKENISSDKYTSMKLCFLVSPLLTRYFRPLTSGLLAGLGSCVLREFSKVGQLPPCESHFCHFFLLGFNLSKACTWLWVFFYLPAPSISGTKQRWIIRYLLFSPHVCFAPVGLCWKYACTDMDWGCWTCLQYALADVLEYCSTWNREAPAKFTIDLLPTSPPRLGRGGWVLKNGLT